MKKEHELEKIYRDIKSIKIQGATNIAKAAVRAYSLVPRVSTINKLESLRPTEPMLHNILNMLKQGKTKDEILEHLENAQENINLNVFKLIKNRDIIFTHCHSTNVVKSLIYAKKHGKRFEVYNTETRPLFQGKKTAIELNKAKIKVTMFPDSAGSIALSKEQGTKKVSKVFLGADAILSNGDVINKVGSEMFAQIAKSNKIPVYIIADSWKFSRKQLELEQRNYGEVWDNAPRTVKIKNPAFERINRKFIKRIVSDLGIYRPKKFVRKARKSLMY
ncbi:MAG: hypothetical protein WC533_03630 [Candidatus Pacearchaeota archaeon]